MKKVTKFIMAALLAGICSFGYGQNNNTEYEWKKPPKPTEIIIGTVSTGLGGGDAYIYETKSNGKKWGNDRDDRLQRPQETDEVIYSKLLEKAQREYGKTNPKFALRSFNIRMSERRTRYNDDLQIERTFYGEATVVITRPEEAAKEILSDAVSKAMRRVRQGSRIAIDQVTVWSGINMEEYKDQLIDMLLDQGYKVVAKEHLQRLYEEQQNQQSGIYNGDTTVQENNFSAVGYYINVKVTETTLRVQVVNVSTGEYEGNATINF